MLLYFSLFQLCKPIFSFYKPFYYHMKEAFLFHQWFTILLEAVFELGTVNLNSNVLCETIISYLMDGVTRFQTYIKQKQKNMIYRAIGASYRSTRSSRRELQFLFCYTNIATPGTTPTLLYQQLCIPLRTEVNNI